MPLAGGPRTTGMQLRVCGRGLSFIGISIASSCFQYVLLSAASREDEEQVLLVVPYWPNRTGFPEPVLLATVPPWPIPLRKDLLSQRRGTLWHLRLHFWKLHVPEEARRLNPPHPPSIPSWDLSLVLSALQRPPFEPLQSAELKILSIKTVLLTALASIKRVGVLQAFSVDELCLEFGPADSHVVLRPRPGYEVRLMQGPGRANNMACW
ncbi:unnamed protein product [Leuciscus chuanchicus]